MAPITPGRSLDKPIPGPYIVLAFPFERIAPTQVFHRTQQTIWIPGVAQYRAEVHERLIEVIPLALGNQRFRKMPEPLLVGFRISRSDEDPVQDSHHVGVQDRSILIEGERSNGPGGIAADPFER